MLTAHGVGGGAAAPPLRVVRDRLRVGNTGSLEEHNQVVVAGGGAEDSSSPLLCTLTLRLPREGLVHDNQRTAQPPACPGPGERRVGPGR